MLDRLRARAQRTDEGFTLIELLIVIVILGILAAIVVFAVGNTGKDSASAACQSDVKTVETALEAAKAQTSAYPSTIDALVTAGYLREAPSSDYYTISTDGSGAVIVAKGTQGTIAGGTLSVGGSDTAATVCAS